MNKRRRKKEMVKYIKQCVEKDIDFIYFKGWSESYLLPLIRPTLSMNLSPESAPEINIVANISNQQARKFIMTKKKGWHS